MNLDEPSDNTDCYSEHKLISFLSLFNPPPKKSPLHHNKVMIIGGEVVITGSFNFTKGAEENNAENLLVIRDKKLAERYTKNWEEHAGCSEVYAGRMLKR